MQPSPAQEQTLAQSPKVTRQSEAARQFVSESRQMLHLFQIGESQLELFSDGQTLSDDGFATLVRLLYRAPAFPMHKVHRWSQWNGDFEQLRAEPNRYRGAFLRLAGQARSIEKITVPAALQQRFAFDHFYRVALENTNESSVVYCRSLPEAWGESVTGQAAPRGSVSAMFVKLGAATESASSEGLPIVAVANTFAWHPNALDEANGVTSDHVLLASLGMDINQFSFVEDRKALTASDRECFYQLLDVTGRIAKDDSLSGDSTGTENSVDVTELLQNPESHRARQYSLVGTVRRAVKIQVDDIDIVERFGIDHYYELEIFTNPDVTVRFVDESGDDKVFTRYPIVVCLRSVPDWLPQGADVHANVVVSGFFLKHWAYKTQYMSEGAPSGTAERLQISPLLVGTQIRPFALVQKSSSFLGLLCGALFAMLLVSIAVYVWKSEKGNREFRQKRRARSTVDLESIDRGE